MARTLTELSRTKLHSGVEHDLGDAGLLIVDAGIQPYYTSMLRMDQVCLRTGLSKSQIRRMVGDLDFPEPVRLSMRAVAWVAADIESWLQQRITATRKAG